MNIDNLISELADEGVKKPLPNPFMQTLYWFIPTFIIMGIATYFLGIRPDIHDKIGNPIYVAEILSLLLTTMAFTLTAFYYSRPDIYQKPWIIWAAFLSLPVPFVFGYIGASDFLTMVGFEESLHNHMGKKCSTCITVFAIPAIITLFSMLRLGASVHPGKTGMLASVAAAILSYTVLRVNEANDNPAHIIVWHVFPVIFIAFIGILAGYIFLRWKK